MPYRKKVILFFISLTLSSQFIFVNETYAFQGSMTESAVNTFASQKKYAESDIEEPNGDSYKIADSKVSDKLIMISNTGSIPVYVRVKISVCVKNKATGEVTSKPVIVNGDIKDGFASVKFGVNEKGGWKTAPDGFFYYGSRLMPGTKTTQLISGGLGGEIEVSGIDADEYISFTVISETSGEAFYG